MASPTPLPGIRKGIRRCVPVMVALIILITLRYGMPYALKVMRPSLHWQTRELIDAASMEPVEIALSTRLFHTYGGEKNGLPERLVRADNRIVFRLPAAYVTSVQMTRAGELDKALPGDKNLPGASILGLVFWSRSFDPVRPDRMADYEHCERMRRIRKSGGLDCDHGPDGGRTAARYRGGEFPFHVELGAFVGTEADRRFNIHAQAGFGGTEGKGCIFHEEPTLGMLVGRGPQGQRSSSECRANTNHARLRDGRLFSGATFLKQNEDGSPRFGVFCYLFLGPDDNAGSHSCEMRGYFGIWYWEASVPSDRVREWDAVYERLNGFLTQHVIEQEN